MMKKNWQTSMSLALLLFSHSVLGDSYVSPYIPLEKVNEALGVYKEDCGRYPTQKEGLMTLVHSAESCWQGPYMIERFLSGYRKRPINYAVLEFYGNQYIQLSTYGEDHLCGTADDIRLSDDMDTRRLIFRLIIDRSERDEDFKIISMVFGSLLFLAMLLNGLIDLISWLKR